MESLTLSSIEVGDYCSPVETPTRAAASLDDAHEIAGLLFQIAEQTRHVFESAARRFDLTPPQARALLELQQPVSMRFVADRLRCDASNVTGIVDRLEARELVTREPDPSDRRIKSLVLTPEGHRARSALENAVRSSPVMAGLNAGERRTLLRLLSKVATGRIPAAD